MEHLPPGADPTAVGTLLLWLQDSALGMAARRSTWLYPLASVLHILGLGLLLGAIAAFDLRVLGLARALPLAAAARLLLPLAMLGLAVQLGSGLVLFAADASHVAYNSLFLLKLATIALALLNVLIFHGRAGRTLAHLGDAEPPGWARVTATVSLLAWLATASLGRMIAYV